MQKSENTLKPSASIGVASARYLRLLYDSKISARGLIYNFNAVQLGYQIVARVEHNPQPEMSVELNGGWAIDLLVAQRTPYSLSVTSVIKSVAELPSIFVKKSCFLADILLHLFT
ncbi:MAG: hypothetical protein ABI180_14875 [Microcoleus sp.]